MSEALLVYFLATWRLSYMLVREDGPFKLASKLRDVSGIQHDDEGRIFSYPDWNPLHCVYCTSMWVAIGLYFVPRIVLRTLAASGIAVIIEKYHGDR